MEAEDDAVRPHPGEAARVLAHDGEVLVGIAKSRAARTDHDADGQGNLLLDQGDEAGGWGKPAQQMGGHQLDPVGAHAFGQFAVLERAAAKLNGHAVFHGNASWGRRGSHFL